MKVLGVGLSKTGTTSLHEALTILGLKSIHYDMIRLNDILDGSARNPDFRRYDDVDAVSDIPSAFFYRELLAAYPAAKAVLTIRDVDEWWPSVEHHYNERLPIYQISWKRRLLASLSGRRQALEEELRHLHLRTRMRHCVFGSESAVEFLYKKRFVEHNERVQREVPHERLLVMNVAGGDGWEKLCPFLGKALPTVPFPRANPKRARGARGDVAGGP